MARWLAIILNILLIVALIASLNASVAGKRITRKLTVRRPQKATATNTNILLFISDDLRADVEPYSTEVAATTPNLKAFAVQSLTFANAYVQMSTCGPSRNSFLTGRRNDNLRSWNFMDDIRRRSRSVITLPQLFKLKGYDTISIGKVMHSYKRIKDDKPSWSQILFPSRVNEQSCPVTGKLKQPQTWCECGGGSKKSKTTKTVLCQDSLIASAAIQILRTRAKRPGKPFFLAVGFRRPHVEFIVPQGYPDFSFPPFNDLPAIKIPPNFDQPTGMPNVAFHACDDVQTRLPFIQTADRLKPWSIYPDSLYSSYRQAYFRAVSYMDQQMGRVLRALDAIPSLRDNTLVVFVSDNGKAVGERNHFCKNGLFDVHNRIPMIMRPPPGVFGGSEGDEAPSWRGAVVHAEVELLDLYRTVTAITKMTNPDCLSEGRDLTPYFVDPQSQPYPPIEQLLTTDIGLDLATLQVTSYSFALSQMPRCNIQYGASEACTNTPSAQFQVMGYTLKTTNWRYSEWRNWIGSENDVDWSLTGLNATELYRHDNPRARYPSLHFDYFENENVLVEMSNTDPAFVKRFSEVLQWVVKSTRDVYPSQCQPRK